MKAKHAQPFHGAHENRKRRKEDKYVNPNLI